MSLDSAIVGKAECLRGEERQWLYSVLSLRHKQWLQESESLDPAQLINHCGKAPLAVTKGQERFIKKSQLQFAKCLVDLTLSLFQVF